MPHPTRSNGTAVGTRDKSAQRGRRSPLKVWEGSPGRRFKGFDATGRVARTGDGRSPVRRSGRRR